MLSDSTRLLLEDAFEDRTIFDGLPRIRQRIVAWGSFREPVVLPHTGIVVSESALLERLWQKADFDASSAEASEWEIRCSGNASAEGERRRFGSRVAFAFEAWLSEQASPDACWIESVENGWLFLISAGEQRASLLAIGASAEELLEGSRLIAKQIGGVDGAGFQFPAHPAIHTPLTGDSWIACGTAALGFDPIGGEGVGNAVREAVLASAVIRAILRGGDVSALMSHYSARLIGGFFRHLESCIAFYGGGGSSPWWRSQLAELKRGIDWTRSEAGNWPPARYRLVNFDLESLA
jgi:hypothetical protein